MSDRPGSRSAKGPRRRAVASLFQAPWSSSAGTESIIDPTRVGELAPTQEDILFLYEAVTWPASLAFRQILQPAPLPSPFSPVLPEWLDNTVGDPLGGIKELYDLVLLNYSELRNEFSLRYPSFSSGNRQSGFLCWSEYIDPLIGENEDETSRVITGGWVERLGVSSLNLLVGTLRLSSNTRADIVKRDLRTEPGQSRDYWVKDIKLHGLKKDPLFVQSGATEYDYFILNDFEEPFSVNGVPIAKGMVAGPLPDFAIIDIGGFFVLWWASQAGVEYVPEKKQDVSAFLSNEAGVDSDSDVG